MNMLDALRPNNPLARLKEQTREIEMLKRIGGGGGGGQTVITVLGGGGIGGRRPTRVPDCDNANRVDGFHAAGVATPNMLLALDAQGNFDLTKSGGVLKAHRVEIPLPLDAYVLTRAYAFVWQGVMLGALEGGAWGAPDLTSRVRVRATYSPAIPNANVLIYSECETAGDESEVDLIATRTGHGKVGIEAVNKTSGAYEGWIEAEVTDGFIVKSRTLSADLPARLFHVKIEDAEYKDIVFLERLTHKLIGGGDPAGALFGVGEEHELENSVGNLQVASEVVTLWAVPTSEAEVPLRRWTTYPAGSAGPGYGGFVTANDVAGVAVTIVPNGAGDVTCVLSILYAICESGGGTSGGATTVDNGAAINLFNVAGETLTLTVNANGSVQLQRTAGTSTYDVSLFLCWV